MPRSRTRWLPGCQTFTSRFLHGARHRRGSVKRAARAHRPVDGSSRFLRGAWHRTWLGGTSGDFLLRDHALELAVLVDLAVDLARPDQVVVGAARGDAAVVEDDDLVGERDGR